LAERSRCIKCGRKIGVFNSGYVKFSPPDPKQPTVYLCWKCWRWAVVNLISEGNKIMGAAELVKLAINEFSGDLPR
jgi:DNA-directed RNA polymerase subunit RPC12/RpoP